MNIKIDPKETIYAYSTPIVQQTSFWSKVKERLGMDSCAFEFSVRNSDLYTGVGPDITKMQLIVFDPVHHGYIQLGEKVGQAFADGKSLM